MTMSGRWAGGGRSGLGKLKQQPRSNAKTLFGRLGNAVLKSAGRLSASPVVTEAMTAHYAFFLLFFGSGQITAKKQQCWLLCSSQTTVEGVLLTAWPKTSVFQWCTRGNGVTPKQSSKPEFESGEVFRSVLAGDFCFIGNKIGLSVCGSRRQAKDHGERTLR